MRRWRFLPVISAPMPFQMAVDEIIFRTLEKQPADPLFRLYYSSEPWVSVGFSFPLSERKCSAPICRRMTGGGWVEHGKDLIFSLVAKKSADDSFSSVAGSYVKIHEAVKKGLEYCGVQPRFYRCTEDLPKGRNCFQNPIASDLALGNVKVAGGAQKRSSGTLLHQESIAPFQSLRLDLLEKEILKGFSSLFEVEWEPLDLPEGLFKEAEALAKKSYPDQNGVCVPSVSFSNESGVSARAGR